MSDIVLTVTITGSDDALDAAFPAVPSSAEDDQGMTTVEVAADAILAMIEDDDDARSGLNVRVDPARRLLQPVPLRDRAAEMADWIAQWYGRYPLEPSDATTPEECAAWSQYVLGLTDERPS